MTDRTGTYNPFEDTGDWPFRESVPPPVEQTELGQTEREQAGPPERPFDREELEAAASAPEPAPLQLDGEHEEPAVEPEPEPEPVVLASPPPEPVAATEPEPDPGPKAEADLVPAVAAAVPVEQEADEAPEPDEADPAAAPEPPAVASVSEHAPGELVIPEGTEVLEGAPNGFRRTVAIVVSRFNADVTNRLLESAIDALVDAHVARESITVVPVPGAFELPLAAIALAKTRRFSCVVALGCVIRGETPHFDFVASEAASGLQLAAIETGVPVSFGLLTCETKAQAEARAGKGEEAARAALEMADLFTQVRTRSARTG